MLPAQVTKWWWIHSAVWSLKALAIKPWASRSLVLATTTSEPWKEEAGWCWGSGLELPRVGTHWERGVRAAQPARVMAGGLLAGDKLLLCPFPCLPVLLPPWSTFIPPQGSSLGISPVWRGDAFLISGITNSKDWWIFNKNTLPNAQKPSTPARHQQGHSKDVSKTY